MEGGGGRAASHSHHVGGVAREGALELVEDGVVLVQVAQLPPQLQPPSPQPTPPLPTPRPASHNVVVVTYDDSLVTSLRSRRRHDAGHGDLFVGRHDGALLRAAPQPQATAGPAPSAP